MLPIGTEDLHDASLAVLYAAGVLATFVALERLLTLGVLRHAAGRIGRALQGLASGQAVPPAALAGRDPLSRALAEYNAAAAGGVERARREDLSGALVIEVEARCNARLWLLDTVITAAPLLGLLGTILGIMDTFATLAESGISDPGAVSRGIGQALYATAIGIGTALYALVWFNLLQRLAEGLGESFRGFLLRIG